MSQGHDSESIYYDLRERISLLDHPPGTLLSENRLAAEYGVSRTPVRRALHHLEFDGLVTVSRGVGTIVTPIDMMYLKQVYALRLKLLDLIAELSPAHVTGGDLVILEALLDEVRAIRVPYPPRRLAETYLRFNEELSRAIGNRPLREIADRYFHQTSRVWIELLPELDQHEEVDAIAQEIEQVTRALSARDMASVARVRRDHFERCLRRMNDRLVGADLDVGQPA